MKIFLDFDDTIFNTKQFKKDLQNIFFKHGVTKKEFAETFLDYPQKLEKRFLTYDVKEQLSRLKKIKGKSDILSREVDKFMSNLRKYVFGDFQGFSRKFSRKNIFLISFGNKSFQKRKMKASGMLNFVSRIVILNDNKAFYIKKIMGKNFTDEKIFFIDDRPDQLEMVRKEIPKLKIIRIKRKEGRYVELKCKIKSEEVSNLREAAKIINAYID